MISVIKTLLLLTIFLLPLIGPIWIFGYEQTKVIFFVISITLCAFLWAIYSLKHEVKIRGNSINIVALILIVILFLTSALGVNPWASLIGAQPYFQGWILYAYLYYFFLLLSWLRIKFELLVNVLVWSGTLVGVLAISDWLLLNIFHQSIPNYAGRVISTFGQPNFYSGYMLFSLPFFLYLFKSKPPFRWWTVSSFLISILAILLSQSRIAYLMLSGLLVLFLSREIQVKSKKIIVLSTSLIIFLVTLVIAGYSMSGFFGKEVIAPVVTNNPDLTKASVENRVYIWPVAWQAILLKPFYGYGLENIQLAFSDYFITNKHALFEENLKISPVLISLKDLYIDRSHNYLLDLIFFSGFLGLGVWIIFLIMILKKLIRIKNSLIKFVLFTSLMVYLVWVQFQNQSVVHLTFFWLTASIINGSDS